MSTIAAGTAIGTALVSTGDTSGTLQLQVNGTTPAVTLNTAGAVGVGSTPAYGTSGQVLVSGGTAAAPAWTNQSALTAGSATNILGGSVGTIHYQSATNTTAMLAVGTSGQVLTSQGAAAPIWATPDSGAMTLLSTTTVTSEIQFVDITTPFTNTYKHFLIVLDNVLRGSISGQSFGMRVFRGGSLVTSSTYSSAYGTIGNTGINSNFSDTSLFLPFANNTIPTNGRIYLWNAFSSAPSNMFIEAFTNYANSNPSSNPGIATVTTGYNYASGTFSGIRIYVLDATYGYVGVGSKFHVYGIK
jgi:hypothetical protein